MYFWVLVCLCISECVSVFVRDSLCLGVCVFVCVYVYVVLSVCLDEFVLFVRLFVCVCWHLYVNPSQL